MTRDAVCPLCILFTYLIKIIQLHNNLSNDMLNVLYGAIKKYVTLLTNCKKS